MASRRFRWLKIALCSMLLGGLWTLFEYNEWMSLRNYSIKAADPVLERRFWEMFPSQCLRFWPFFIRKSQDMGSFLEKTLPIVVRTKMTGFGVFSTDIELLSPWVVIEWRGIVWCVSREGKMWNTSDPSTHIKGLDIPQKPLWRMSPSAFPLSQDERPLPGGVFPSLFSVEVIEKFLTEFENEPWFKDAQEIFLDRRAGADLLKLRLVRGKQEFVILIQRDKYGWRELNIALEHILDRLLKEGGNHLIDATYEDKIVVRNLSTGAGEGSSK